MKTILIIEDDQHIRELLTYNLQRENFEVVAAKDGRKGLDFIYQIRPDLIILDLMIPEINGVEICQKIKSDPLVKKIPLIILSAKGQESDIIYGLGMGADDYITKPFSTKEVIARVYARLRNKEQQTQPKIEEKIESKEIPPVSINYDNYQINIYGKPLSLTVTEFKLFSALTETPKKVLTRDSLLSLVNNNESTFVIDRNIDVHILSIRKKLGKNRNFIQTVRGIGYKYQAENIP